MTKTRGIHHVTAITSDPQKNLNFYEGFLGQRLVKRTVNFDDPNAYHLYYGDAVGSPGTIMTFFYWKNVSPGVRGNGEVSSIYYAIPVGTMSFWRDRAQVAGVMYEERTLPFGEVCLMISDPDGLLIGLVEADIESSVVHWEAGPIAREYSLRGFYGALLDLPTTVTLEPVLTEGLGYEVVETRGGVSRYQATVWPGKFLATRMSADPLPARQGAGSVHHIAFQAHDDDERDLLRKQVNALGVGSTGLVDRKYFHSTYFMTPAAVLFEIATDDIGFTIDESPSELGEHLLLPAAYEQIRHLIEAGLVPLSLPRHNP